MERESPQEAGRCAALNPLGGMDEKRGVRGAQAAATTALDGSCFLPNHGQGPRPVDGQFTCGGEFGTAAKGKALTSH
jgi:hypothetical protein